MAPYQTRRKRSHLSTAYLSKWLRVLSNISAGLLILGTGLLVSLLLYQGMFYSQNMTPIPQSIWTPFVQACQLTSDGFVPGSCSGGEVASTGAVAWTSLGEQLAADLLRNATDPAVFATTCLYGATNESAWATIVFVVGEAAFPLCNPVGKQVVLGMATIETVATDEFPDGAFLLSTLSDASPAAPVTIQTTNSGKHTVDRSVVKTIVATNGTRAPAPWTQRNYVVSLNSLNRLFLMRLWMIVYFVDISKSVNTLVGYSVGKTSGTAVTIVWDNSHNVDSYMLLLAFQSLICFVSLGLLSNDGVITLEGLSGLLKNKPVLTYDILASLERRKLLLVSLVCTFFFSPLYADAIRYTYPDTGHHYWSLTLLMVAVMMALSWMALLTACQSLPVPTRWRNRPLCYSAPVFVYCTILFFVVYEASQSRGVNEYEAMWSHAESTLGLYLFGQMWSSGAYSMDGMTPVIYLLMPDLMVCMLLAWVVSIVAHKWLVGYAILDTSWTSHNDFVNQLPRPQWVTSLDLDHKNTISIGTKLYCKPSFMVLLGYCAIRDKATKSGAAVSNGTTQGTTNNASSHHSSTHDKGETNLKDSSYATAKENASTNASRLAHNSPTSRNMRPRTDYVIISIYDLVASIVPWVRQWVYSPKVFGMIASNKFELTKSHIRLQKKAEYTYSRGDCCG